jgi:hypothetical protein
MNPLRILLILLLSALILAGCQSNNEPPDEKPISLTRQEAYLEAARPPQQFGFSIYPEGNGLAYSGNGRLHPNHLATAKMLEDTIPVITFRGKARRNTMKVLIDYSSSSSWIEFLKSQKFGAYFMGINDMVIPYRGGYNTGRQNAYAGVITQLRIEGLFMENVPFYIRMASGSLGPLARGILSPHVDAVMGYDNLQAFEYVQIDLRNNQIIFSASTPYVPHDDLLMTTAKIMKLRGHGLAVEGAIDGQPLPILLDFAGNFHFARGDIKVSTTTQVSLGEVVFRQVPTLILPAHNSPASAGRQMLAPYIVTICSKEGVVYFERPAQ